MKDFLVDVMSRFQSFSRHGVILNGGESTVYAINPQRGGTSMEDFKTQVKTLTLAVGRDRSAKANLGVALKDILRLLKDADGDGDDGKSGFRKGVPKVFVVVTTSSDKPSGDEPSGDELRIIREIQALGTI